MMEERLNDRSLRRKFYGNLLRIAVPVMFQNLIAIALNLIDTIMIGRVGEVELAAVGSANQVNIIVSMAIFGFYSGAMAYVSQYWGVRDIKNIRRVVGINMLVGASIAVAVWICAMLFAPQLIMIFSRDQGVIADGTAYIRIASFTYLPFALSYALSFNSRAIERLMGPTVVNIVAIAMNTVLNYALIFGHFGFEAMGVRGAAVATLVARCFEMALMFILVYSDKNHPLRLTLKDIRAIDSKLMKTVTRTALPVVATEGGWSICVALVFAAYGIMGPAAQAVVQVAEVIVNLFQSLFFGLGSATTVLIGKTLGRGDMETAYRYASMSIKIGWALNLILTAAVFLMRGMVAGIYNFPAETTELLFSTLGAWALTITPKMFSYLLISGILRAGGDTVYCLIVDMGFNALAQVPLAFIGVSLGLPLWAVVLLVALPDAIKSVICYMRMRSRKWMNKFT